MFAYTEGERWRFGIGDPTLMGWLTVGAYWLAAWLCWVARGPAGRLPEKDPTGSFKRSRLFWAFCALFLVALGINKQLDLQTWFTLFAKQLALQQGWYEYRRAVQAGFIVLVTATGLALLAWMTWLAGSGPWPTKLALVGVVFLGGFVLIRASSFHQVDQMLGFRVAGLKLNWVFELSGIGCLAVAAARVRRQAGRLEQIA